LQQPVIDQQLDNATNGDTITIEGNVVEHLNPHSSISDMIVIVVYSELMNTPLIGILLQSIFGSVATKRIVFLF